MQREAACTRHGDLSLVTVRERSRSWPRAGAFVGCSVYRSVVEVTSPVSHTGQEGPAGRDVWEYHYGGY